MSEVQFCVRFHPDWDRVERVRNAVRRALSTIYDDADACDAGAMVCAELLENAIKYAEPANDEVTLELHRDREGLVIRTINSAKAGSETLAQLQTVIGWIGEFSDPYDAYLERMRLLMEAETIDGGLGLVRVVYEGRCQLRCSVDATRNQVEVVARATDLRG